MRICCLHASLNKLRIRILGGFGGMLTGILHWYDFECRWEQSWKSWYPRNCQRLTHYAAIIHNIKELLPRDWRIHIVHTCREGNACADYLAKFGASHPETYSPLADPPRWNEPPLVS
ncbi:hypothetical protein L195_g038448 [Trifolium pratense]|uniref:RNase H type-1 domain-containing protein n=1 Tax=Trifolium pratense TaxID=57577 RepID=A0A2K3LV89_TRIPR|nr:hypothetical protein L195_g038448 [Trifolium pratense]